jgi:hypothetical protein
MHKKIRGLLQNSMYKKDNRTFVVRIGIYGGFKFPKISSELVDESNFPHRGFISIDDG